MSGPWDDQDEGDDDEADEPALKAASWVIACVAGTVVFGLYFLL